VLLHIGQNIDERKHPAQDKERDSENEESAQLQNDCAPNLHHRAILTASAPLRNSA
jgi:hypothetical protein